MWFLDLAFGWFLFGIVSVSNLYNSPHTPWLLGITPLGQIHVSHMALCHL